MTTTKIRVNGKTILITLDEGRHIGQGFIHFVEVGLKKGYTYGNFKGKHSKVTVGTWKVKDSWFSKFFINNFRTD